MRTKLLALVALAAAASLVSVPVSAHHGAASYDSKKLTTLKGTVTEFRYINPHSELFLDVADASGTPQKWIAELVSVASLSRYGWTKNTLKPGDQISITGNAAKNGSHTMRLSKLTLPSGKVLSIELAEDYAGK
jgi:Family of unknown function (DUF6152)